MESNLSTNRLKTDAKTDLSIKWSKMSLSPGQLQRDFFQI